MTMPAEVAALFARLGAAQVDIGVTGADPFVQVPGNGAQPWRQALITLGDELARAREDVTALRGALTAAEKVLLAVTAERDALRLKVAAIQAAKGKPFYLTTEFWMGLAGTGTAVTALVASFSDGATGMQAAIAGVLTTVVPLVYGFIRIQAKAMEAAEQKMIAAAPDAPRPVSNPTALGRSTTSAAVSVSNPTAAQSDGKKE